MGFGRYAAQLQTSALANGMGHRFRLDSRTMSTAPRITVLMTLYNKGPYVEEAVRSVLAQTFTDFELLVVDDASTDGGLKRVKAIHDPRIRILESAVNSGRADAANRGYEAARGTYIAVLDADDLMLPERLAKQAAFLDAHPEVGAVGAWAKAFGATDTLITFPASDSGARGQMLFGMPVLYGASMLRGSLLREDGIRSPKGWLFPGEDRLFMLELGRHCQFANLQEVLLRYRTGEQNQRHGRDGVSDMHHLYRAVFRQLGFEVTEEQIRLQTFLHDLGGPPPTVAQVLALGRWVRELKARNRKAGVLPVAAFEAQLTKRWESVFHRVVTQDAWAALLHMVLTGKVRERMGYWGTHTKRRWLGLC